MGTKEEVEWRKNKIMSYMSHGLTNQSELSRLMQVPLSTVNRDYMNLKQEAKEHVAQFQDTFAFEFEKCLTEINAIQLEAWMTSKQTKYERNKILALNLAKDCVIFKTELITNADVIGRTSNFIEIKKKRLQKMMEDEEAEEIDNAVTEALPLPTPDQQQTSDTEEHEIIPYQPQPEETSEA
jgi:hypothetical protein